MIEDEEEDDDFFPAELYDISDVHFEMPKGPNKKRIVLIAKSETDFNLVKWYLALKFYVQKIENELNVMDEVEGEH